MSNQPELQVSVKNRRRQSALINLAQKRTSIVPMIVNLNALVRVYLLDGSSKVLQMYENSTAKDVLISLRFNLDLQDISTHALFRVIGQNVRRVELNEKITDAMRDPTDSGQDVRLLFRTWISYKNGVFDKEVFQDDERHKQANTALWLSVMEATFMCMTGKYYLTEDESIFLGCLKMQSESGDFNPSVHTIQNIKSRVAARFPEPLRSKMRALSTATLSGNGLSDDLAYRVLAVYARIAGKHKIEAQIEYLQCLRTWCPFYGATFFDVQCQYDDNPLDVKSSPPVIAMDAAIGELAIFLITATDPPAIMRHPYKRIIKWIAHADKHIFTYWVIKPDIRLSDIEQYQDSNRGGEFDPRPYCDCVYLVSQQVRELEYLVKSYVASGRDVPPVLPGAPEELQPPEEPDYEDLYHQLLANAAETMMISESKVSPPIVSGTPGGRGGVATFAAAAAHKAANPTPASATPARVSRLSIFLSALGGSAPGEESINPANPSAAKTGSKHLATGSGLDGGRQGAEDEVYGDDVAGVSNSLFKNMYSAPTSSSSSSVGGRGGEDEDASLAKIPAQIKYAASMSELKRVAEEKQFSDDEDAASADEGSSASASEDEDEDSSARAKKLLIKQLVAKTVERTDSGSSAFKRASRVLFGPFATSGSTSTTTSSSSNAVTKSTIKEDDDDDSSSGGGGSDSD